MAVRHKSSPKAGVLDVLLDQICTSTSVEERHVEAVDTLGRLLLQHLPAEAVYVRALDESFQPYELAWSRGRRGFPVPVGSLHDRVAAEGSVIDYSRRRVLLAGALTSGRTVVGSVGASLACRDETVASVEHFRVLDMACRRMEQMLTRVLAPRLDASIADCLDDCFRDVSLLAGLDAAVRMVSAELGFDRCLAILPSNGALLTRLYDRGAGTPAGRRQVRPRATWRLTDADLLTAPPSAVHDRLGMRPTVALSLPIRCGSVVRGRLLIEHPALPLDPSDTFVLDQLGAAIRRAWSRSLRVG